MFGLDYSHITFMAEKEFDLEAAEEAFQESLDALQWNVAEDIAADTARAGHKKAALKMIQELSEAKREDLED